MRDAVLMLPTKGNHLPRTSRTRQLLVVALTIGLLATIGGPALAAPQVRAFGPGIDAYARYDGQSRCLSTEQPGVRDFRALLQRTYGANGGGILRGCSTGGKSEHKEGRAYDWMLNVNNASDKRKADELLGWLLATDAHGNKHAMARRFGVMYIIWNKQVWNAYRPNEGWRPYTGANPHTDHIHFSFSWDGAQRKTSYWTAPEAGQAKVAAAPGPFADVSSRHTFVKEISWAVDTDITTGFADKTFRPGDDVTRGQMVSFLWRLMGKPAVSTAHGFGDVPSDAHYEPALRWAAANDIIQGTSATAFSPGEDVSRVQMARMLHRLAGEPTDAPTHKFQDGHERDRDAVSWLSHHQVTTGQSTTKFAGHHPVNRQQAAAFMYRATGTRAAWTAAPTVPPTMRVK